MKELKAVVFDMGGVILRSMDWGPREAQAKRLGITREEMENEVFGNQTAVLATVGACREAEHWEAVRRTFGIGPEAMPGWRKEFWSGDRMDAELIAWLGNLRPKYKTALLSNAWPEARVTVQQNYPGSLNVFDLVVFSAAGGSTPGSRICG
jgi:FMN phosphatase YigB (HAD superfamily)